ncbi:MAG TPA: hypothetical protein VMS30_04945 [Phycisphaerales bacterium]|nr:hypothetical protein [Phycisphaerales bacterium]
MTGEVTIGRQRMPAAAATEASSNTTVFCELLHVCDGSRWARGSKAISRTLDAGTMRASPASARGLIENGDGAGARALSAGDTEEPFERSHPRRSAAMTAATAQNMAAVPMTRVVEVFIPALLSNSES